METRTILIANSKTQQRHTLQSAATTLGELKAEMDAIGINYAGLDVTEGFSKTRLLDDSSPLPTNVVHRNRQTGEETVTNDLVILLTDTKKKQNLGAEDRTRLAAYELINSMDAIVKEDIKEEFGRNYTQVPTEALWEFLDEYEPSDDEDEEEETEDENTNEQVITEVNCALKEALASLAEINTNLADIYRKVQTCTTKLTDLSPLTYQLGNTEVSDDEVNSMLASL